ncbi:MAG: glycosyltransferase family 4 protein [Lentisphaerota bacterium]
MRVAYIFNHPHIVGGGEISLIELMEAIRPLGVEPFALLPSQGEITERLKVLKIPCFINPMPSLKGLSLLHFPSVVGQMAKMFQQQDIHLAHSNGARCTLYAAEAARKAGIACLWHVRVIERDAVLDRIRGRRVAGIIANSRATAETLRPLIPRNRPVDVIYNGVSLSRIHQAPALDLRSTFNLPGHPVLFVAARVTPEKGLDVLIEACARMTHPHSVVVMGSTPMADYADRLKQQSAALKNSRWIWSPPHPQFINLMKTADLVAIPSRHEGFCRVIPEAWACGIPILATRQGGPAELIHHEKDGWLTPSGNAVAMSQALDHLLQNPDLRQRLSQAGSLRTQEFDLEHTAGQILEVYRKDCSRAVKDSRASPIPTHIPCC